MSSCALRALAVAGLAAFASSAQGVIVLGNTDTSPLSTILGANNPDHQIRVNDKLFTFISWTSVVFPTSLVTIGGYISSNPLLGTGFDIFGGFADVTPGDTTISEFNLRYTVEITPDFIAQGYRIVDSELTFNGNATGPGSYARVDESILNFNAAPGQNLVTTSSVAVFGSNPQANILQDHKVFGPPGYTKLEVNKDVQFFTNTTGGTSTASFVRQSFSQIPSPGGAALIGLAGLLVARRRR